MYVGMGDSQYAPPTDYAVPNPLVPFMHNWRGGPLNEGSLYHGPIYTRPSYRMPWMMRPLRGTGQLDLPEEFVQEFTIIAFSTAVAIAYPDLSDRFETVIGERVQKDGEAAVQDRLFNCIETNFPVEEQPEVELPPIEGEPTPEQVNVLKQLFPRNKVEATLTCFEGPKLGNLAIVLPLVAGGALIFWLATRK